MNRRQVLLGGAATVAAAALPVAAVVAKPMVMAIDYGLDPSISAAFKVLWDAQGEVFRVTGISMEELYARGP